MLWLVKKAVDVILHLDKYLGFIVQTYGTWTYLILFIIIFCETGLVIAPFLPGDSLLFVTGALAGQGVMNIVVLFILLSIAAILGDSFNYWLGSYFGEKVFAKSRFVKKEYLEKTKEFYKKHGKKTIILARFLPIIRTFAPFVAGVGKMEYLQFFSYNIIGGIAWVTTFLLGGYYFGTISWVKENLTLVIFTIIFLSFIPPVIEVIKSRKK